MPQRLRHRGGRCWHEDRGQSTVELALVLPVLVAVALALAQLVLIGQSRIAVAHAAREVGRALVVDPDIDAHATALEAADLESAQLRVDIVGERTPGSIVKIVVSHERPLRLPLVGSVHQSTVTSSLSVRIETQD